jgi:hypothetical protein
VRAGSSSVYGGQCARRHDSCACSLKLVGDAHPFAAGPPVWPNGGEQSKIKDGTSASFDSTGHKLGLASPPADNSGAGDDVPLDLSSAASRISGGLTAPALADATLRCAVPFVLSVLALVSVSV